MTAKKTEKKPTSLAFPTRADLELWLEQHHDTESELWVQIYKKDSGTPSVAWNDCVLAALIWGWIDGQKRSLDEASFLQRLTPRRPGSTWSKRNRELADGLIAEGKMRPPGLVQVSRAKSDGRWEQAYSGSAEMVIPEDFLDALAANAEARKFYSTLDRRNLFAIYHRLHTAKRPETRQNRIARIVEQLAAGRPFHGP